MNCHREPHPEQAQAVQGIPQTGSDIYANLRPQGQAVGLKAYEPKAERGIDLCTCGHPNHTHRNDWRGSCVKCDCLGFFPHPQPEAKKADMVNHPPHYQVNGMECVDVIEGLGLGYHLGTALKYLWRCGRKGDRLEDLKKCRWFIDRAIANLEKAKK